MNRKQRRAEERKKQEKQKLKAKNIQETIAKNPEEAEKLRKKIAKEQKPVDYKKTMIGFVCVMLAVLLLFGFIIYPVLTK